ncbi:MAG TPA: TMEM143 family protein [Pirellulales bacterium]|nr:TMEM143 family protein [Pirellulales bacterium]
MAEKKPTSRESKRQTTGVCSLAIATSSPAVGGGNSEADHLPADHFIPIRQAELIELLAGHRELKAADVDSFRRLAQILSATVHHEYQQELEALKADYAAFDPDADTVPLAAPTASQRSARLDGLFDRLAKLLERANFTHLTRDALEEALHGASGWGLNLAVDFEVFDRLEIFVRGQGIERRKVRNLSTRFRKVEADAETFQRLVVLLKLRPHGSLPKGVDHDDVYLKLFKDIPRMDLEMLLPGTQIKMSLFDRTKIVVPTVSGVAMTGWKLIAGLTAVAASGVYNSFALLGLAGGTIGYGLRSFRGYMQTKERYQLSLTESLYYKNLDNNAGVLMRLVDEAEEQENREALLAYFFLRHDMAPAGLTAEQLDQRIEAFLERQLGRKIDFEVGDALAKLIRWRLVEKLPQDKLRALPLAAALTTLDSAWDQIFSYSQAA